MSLFIDTLTDNDGNEYMYGHCYRVHVDDTETGCGMEYAYYLSDNRLESWHEDVGLVTVTENVTPEFIAALDWSHTTHCHNV